MASPTARAQYPVQLSVSVSEETAARIREEAEERGVSLGAVARDLIADGFDMRDAAAS